jgi:F-type H+-transporting ATPase subunit c
MSKFHVLFALSAIIVGVGLLGASPVIAAEGDAVTAAPALPADFLGGIGAGIGAGLVIMGGAAGISRIGGSAVESMARQPEVAGQINVAMIITAAMIEGAVLFAVVVCLLAI